MSAYYVASTVAVFMMMLLSLLACISFIEADTNNNNNKRQRHHQQPLSSLKNHNSNNFATTTSNNGTYTCMGIDNTPIQCPNTLQCCGSDTMFPSCINSTIDKCCTFWIAATPCKLDQECCGSQGTGASSDAFCCKEDTTCCQTREDGGSQCCTKEEKCCVGENSFCCPEEGSCCGEGCCTEKQTCCGFVCCDKETQYCDTSSNNCEWLTKYPTYSPSAHYKPFDMIWHLNSSLYGVNVAQIPSSPTSDFIAFGDYNFPIISRVNGVSGAIMWSITSLSPGTQAINSLVVNDGSGVVFASGLGFDLSTGKKLYNTSQAYLAMCNGESGALIYQSASVMSFSCWSSSSDSWIVVAVSAKTGVIINSYSPPQNFDSSDTSISSPAFNPRTVAMSSPNAKNKGFPAIIGVDVLSAKEVFIQNDIKFETGWDVILVNPATNIGQGYMATSSNNQFSTIFVAQQLNTLFGVSATSTGKLKWKISDSTYPWTSVLPFQIGNQFKKSRRELVKSVKGATSSNLFAYTNKNNYLEIHDESTGDLVWISDKNFTDQSSNAFTLGSSNYFIWVRALSVVFAVELPTPASPKFSIKWVNSAVIAQDESARFFTTPNSPFLFAQSQSTLKVLSPKDGSIVHSWPLLPQTTVNGVFVDESQKTLRVMTSSGVSVYEL